MILTARKKFILIVGIVVYCATSDQAKNVWSLKYKTQVIVLKNKYRVLNRHLVEFFKV